jgi:hypothetical protein
MHAACQFGAIWLHRQANAAQAVEKRKKSLNNFVHAAVVAKAMGSLAPAASSPLNAPIRKTPRKMQRSTCA